jgi:dipeptidyl aminopeptidase/acylaminoacyl peptidase
VSASVRWIGLLASALAGSAGCSTVSGLQLAELPEARLAVLYRSEEAASKRAGAIKDLQERQQGSGSGAEGVVRLQDLDAMFGGEPEASKRVGEPGHLALVDPRTGRATEVEGAPPGARPLGWSPDHRKLLLAGRWREGMQLFAWDPASSNLEILSSGPHEHPQGCFGVDGRLVALEILASPGRADARLAATPKGGTGLRPLTAGPSDAQPACSPTEGLIASLTVAAEGVPTIMVRSLDAPESPHAIGRGFNPRFTPDGKWIVYAAKTQQGKRLFRVRPDGSGRTALGASTQEENQPALSPDGRYVAYVVESDQRERLWVRRFDGTGDRPLLGDGDGVSPAW